MSDKNFGEKYSEWNLGGKLIFFSSIAAFISQFLPWYDVGIATQSGFAGGWFLLLVFFLYPFIQVLRMNKIKKVWGMVSAGIAVIASIIIIFEATVEIMGETGSVAGSGLYLFLLSAIALMVGVYKYKVETDSTLEIEENRSIDEGVE